jgi:hypothetical protein
MNLKNLVTVFVLGAATVGSVSAASAAPKLSFHSSGSSLHFGGSSHVSAPKLKLSRDPSAHVAKHEISNGTKLNIRPATDRPAVATARPGIGERPVAVGERPVLEGARPIVDGRPVGEANVRPLWIRPESRPLVRERFFAYDPIYVDEAPVIVDESFVGSPFVDGQLVFQLNGVAGAGVQLETLGGETSINTVLITYADGSTSLVPVYSFVDRNNPVIDIQTSGAPIATVTVDGSGSAMQVEIY